MKIIFKIILLLFLSLSWNISFAFNTNSGSKNDKPEYAFNRIPVELLKLANAVTRLDQVSFKIIEINKAIESNKQVITILNKEADHLANYQVLFNKFIKIKYFKATLFDKDGKFIRKLKDSEIQDVSAVSYGTLFSDTRLKVAEFIYGNYPYTVEFEYETELKGTLFYPINYFQSDNAISVEKAIFNVSVPDELKFRFKEQHLKNNATISKIDNSTIYSWKEENLLSFEEEPFAPPALETFPIVITAPNEFEMEDFKGNMETWKNFGQWQNLLNAGRDILPKETKTLLENLTRSIPDQKGKVKKIYEYLQANTRYVGIQVGIGGWQPFEALIVDKYKYGDCKALSNYAKAMLKAIGIESNYTLAYGGNPYPKLLEDFQYNVFNHVILCVPIDKDTIWLECTSQVLPFNCLSSFTADRDVLMITEDGGKVVHTPAYTIEMNKQFRTAEVKVNPNGEAQADVKTTYRGLASELVDDIINSSKEDQKKWLYNNLNIASFEVKSFEMNQDRSEIPAITQKLALKLPNYASVSGDRIFIVPNLMNKITYIPKNLANRKSEVVTSNAIHSCDSIYYNLPEGYKVEVMPENVVLNNPFGDYSTVYKKTIDSKLLYIRTLKTKKVRLGPEAYEELRKFYREIVKADGVKLVIIKG